MGLRTKIDIQATVGFDNAVDDTAFERTFSEMLDTCDNVMSGTYLLAASATNISIPLGPVTQGQWLYLEGDSDFSFRFDLIGNTLIPVRRMVNPASTNAPNVRAYFASSLLFGALWLTNPSVTDPVRVKVCVVGDLTALPVC